MKYFLTCFFLLIFTESFCQITFVGKVIDSSSKKPIKGATITIAGDVSYNDNIISTGEDGLFHIYFSSKSYNKFFKIYIVHKKYITGEKRETVASTLEPRLYVLNSKPISTKSIPKKPISTKQPVVSKPKPISSVNGFYETAQGAVLVFNGTKINFKKVVGNYTHTTDIIIKPYYISDPLQNKYLTIAANEYGVRNRLPQESKKESLINKIYAEDAITIAKMLDADLPSFIEVINANMGEKFPMNEKSKELYFDPKYNCLGEVEINKELSNTFDLSDHHRISIIFNYLNLQAQGNLRIVKRIIKKPLQN